MKKQLTILFSLCLLLLLTAFAQPTTPAMALERFFPADEVQAEWFADDFLAQVPLAQIEELRQQISANGNEGTGVVSRDGHFYNVSFQTVDDWTVVAIEQAPQDATCLRNGNRSCQ